MYGTGTPGIDEPLTRESRWFEVPWGLADVAYVFHLAAASFHPSRRPAQRVLPAAG